MHARLTGGEAEVNAGARAMARAVERPLLVIAEDLTVELANPAFCAMFAVAPEQSEGRRIDEIGGGRWLFPALRELLDGTLAAVGRADDLRVEHTSEDLGHRVLLLSVCPTALGDGDRHILLTIDDLTESSGPVSSSRARRSSPRRSSMQPATHCSSSAGTCE